MSKPVTVASQLTKGVSLSDLELPKMPETTVMQWGTTSPLVIEESEELSDYVFRYINMAARKRSGMEMWRPVEGDLKIAVLRCNILAPLVGGEGAGDGDLIHNGDLILAWMPRSMADTRRMYYRKLNASIIGGVEEQTGTESSMKQGRGGKRIVKDGFVESHKGSLREE